MTIVVVDASVVAKWFLPERYSNESRTLRDAYVDGAIDLCAPSAMPFEVANALKYSDLLDNDRIEQSMTAVSEYAIDLIAFADIAQIVDLAIEEDIPIYDAAYVALAEAIDSVCWTADGTLIKTLSSQSQDYVNHIREFDEVNP